jgi:single-strand DNA-binding protein
MAFSINQIFLCGKVGRDAEISTVGDGVSKARFSVATTHGVKKGQQWENVTTWHNVILWRNERLAAEIVKGATVTVRGRQEHRQYDAKDGTKKIASEVVADDVIVFWDSSDQRQMRDAPTASPKGSGGDWPVTEIDDTDIPF